MDGAKLFYSDSLIQQAGVFVSEGYPGIYIYLIRDKNDPGYFNKLNLVQNYSVVEAACLAIRKELFMKVDTQTNQYAFPPRVMHEWQDKEITKYD